VTEVYRTASEEETGAVAERFASGLPPGAVVLLTGDLGAGKTAFVRGMAAGLGIDPEDVSSPTFTLIQEYRPSTRSIGRRVLSHVDLYRLEGAEVDDLGLDELSAGGGVVAIEWAEKMRTTPPGAVRVAIADLGGDVREIRIEWDGEADGSGGVTRPHAASRQSQADYSDR
jgi:tRNA threonylcarbamoyladenosine biosynthesis protein TsaE